MRPAHSAREIEANRRTGGPRPAASMRPAHSAREITHMRGQAGHCFEASMRPAHSAREIGIPHPGGDRHGEASMRPAHSAREITRTFTRAYRWSSGFNEARAFSAGNPYRPSPIPEEENGFNEARAFSAGNRRHDGPRQRGGRASMRPAHSAREISESNCTYWYWR